MGNILLYLALEGSVISFKVVCYKTSLKNNPEQRVFSASLKRHAEI